MVTVVIESQACVSCQTAQLRAVAWLRMTILVVLTLLPLTTVRAAAPFMQMQAEAMLSTDNPYAQQTVVYTVRVLSWTNILEFSPDPPTVPGAVLELLEETPRTYLRPTENGTMVVNEYRYALTPLVAGRIEVPATHLSGKAEAFPRDPYQSTPQRGIPFQVQTQRVMLHSRVAPTNAVQPWLPLQALELISEGNVQRARVGEPFTLSLWLRAMGARGQRLPILADRLQSPDFRVYQEKPVEYWQDAAPDGNTVRGQRHETLTIVPLKTGLLHLPTIRIAWWDTTKNQPAMLEWKNPEIQVVGATEALEQPGTDAKKSAKRWLIALVVVVALLLGSAWVVGHRQQGTAGLAAITHRMLTGGRRMGQWLRPLVLRAWAPIVASYRAIRARLGAALAVVLGGIRRFLALGSRFTGINRFLVRLLPSTVYFWWLLHQIKRANSAASIAHALRNYATLTLARSRNSPLTAIADALIAAYPTLDGPSVTRLFHQMDAALYGERAHASSPDGQVGGVDLTRWKQNFREVTRSLGHSRPRTVSAVVTQQGLPTLNPVTNRIDQR